MDRCLFIAEIETVGAVSHVWIQKGMARPRSVCSEDVTDATLQAAEFHGAPRHAIVTWLTRFTTPA